MPVIYVKLCAIFQPNGGCVDFFYSNGIIIFIFGFLCLIKPDSDRISTLEPFVSKKMGYYTVYVSHLGFKQAIKQVKGYFFYFKQGKHGCNQIYVFKEI